MNRNRILGLMLAVALLIGAVAVTAPAQALPAYENVTIYYSDASHTTEVGERGIDCWGHLCRWGTTSAYYETFSVPCI